MYSPLKEVFEMKKFKSPGFIVLSGFLTMSLWSSMSSAQKPTGAPKTPVFVSVVEREDFSDEIEALGTLQSKENVELTSTVVELVKDINFTDGQRVKRGDVLLIMDSEGEAALRAEESSRLEEARRQVNRIKPLLANRAASKSALDEAELQLQTTQARLNELDTRIEKRTIRAPFDGVLGLRNISVGALMQPGTLITTIDDDSVMKLDFSVPEIFLTDLKPGVKIQARASAYPDEVFSGEIRSVSSRVNPVTRAIAIRALLQNPDRRLKPGLLMRLNLKRNPRQALLIPEESLLVQGNKKFVFVVKNDGATDIAKKVEVETGGRRRGEIEVVNGLGVGDKVVTHGTLRIRDGSKVSVDAIEKNNESLSELLKQKLQAES